MSRLAILALLGLGSLYPAAADAQGTPDQPPANGRHPIVSPDGHRILFTSERADAPGLYVINEDGSGAVRIAANVEGTGRPVWSADGKRLLFGRITEDTVRVFSMSPDGTGLAELGSLKAPGARADSVSADGSRIVYGAGPWPAMQLFSATMGGSAAKQITPGQDAYWCPAISRDGQRVAVGRRDSTGTMQAWVMNVDGSEARQVTRFTKEQGNPQCPAWLADGRMLAVQSAVPVPQDTTKHLGYIWAVDVASSAATQLGEHSAPYLDELPSWFPDGKRIAFQSDRTGRWELWVINTDGTGARRLTR